MKKKVLFLLFTIISIVVNAFDIGTRIAWVYNMRSFVTQGVYARVKLLSDNSMALVYNKGDILYIRKKSMDDKSWGNPIQVSFDNMGIYNYTNAELIELSDGRLIYVWNARPKIENKYPYKIMMKISEDKGETWSREKDIYIAGNTKRDGCWEPVCLELPSGEVQIYFANEYKVEDNFQNITMLRSFDKGSTWGDETIICYRDKYRDGMPVPILLDDGIAVAIEDNGISGPFKPAIVYTDLQNNWENGYIDGNSENRWEALRDDCKLEKTIYAGAPYLIKLDNGEMVLSVQSGEGRQEANTQNHALMQVYIGNEKCRNFARKSTPFNFIDSNPSVLWNSLCKIDSATIMAVSSISGLNSQNGIWTATGKLFDLLEVEDCRNKNNKYGDFSSLFIGAEGYANLRVKSSWDDNNLYLLFNVFDPIRTLAEDNSPLWMSDGVEVYIDPNNNNTETISSGVFKLLSNYKGKYVFHKSFNGVWQEVESQIKCISEENSTGYTLEMIIPWSEFDGVPEGNFGIHIKLHNNDNNKKFIHENLSGGNCDKPNTWLPCILKNRMSSLVEGRNNESEPIYVWPTLLSLDNNILNYKIKENMKPEISIYDNNGNLYYSKKILSEVGTLNLPYKKGLLLLQLKQNGLVLSTKKVIVY